MNEGAFFDSLKKGGSFLRNLEILQKINYNNIKKSSSKKYSKEFIETCRTKIYVKIYGCAMENDDYDFLLKDGSFFQFSLDLTGESEKVRFAYYPSVYSVTYDQFLDDELKTSYEEVGDEFLEIYQQYVIEKIPNAVTPIRYDYDDGIYAERLHSAAHLHFGNEENIRVPINRRIKPMLFVKLVIEYYFFEWWKKAIIYGDESVMYANEDFEEIDGKFFSVNDQNIPYVNILKRLK